MFLHDLNDFLEMLNVLEGKTLSSKDSEDKNQEDVKMPTKQVTTDCQCQFLILGEKIHIPFFRGSDLTWKIT